MKFPEQYRLTHPGNPQYNSNPGDTFGTFAIPAHKAPGRRTLCIIACDGELSDWEHVSVSFGANSKSIPSWEEMCFVKDLFFEEEDCVVQFHPAKSNYVNIHSGVLHLWRSVKEKFPTPPLKCV